MNRYCFLSIVILMVAYLMGCRNNSTQDSREKFSLLVVVNTNLRENNPDGEIPDSIQSIVAPLTTPCMKQKVVSWKANVKLVRIDIDKYKEIQLSPFDRNLQPKQDSIIYVGTIKKLKLDKLDAQIFDDKLRNVDSVFNSQRNLDKLLKNNRDAMKISYNSNIKITDAEDTVFKAKNIQQVKDIISVYLCSASLNKKIIVYYNISSKNSIQQGIKTVLVPDSHTIIKKKRRLKINSTKCPCVLTPKVDPLEIRDSKDQKIDRNPLPKTQND